MTVIAATKTTDGIKFAADSISVSGHLHIPDPAMGKGKLFQQNGMIVGGTGDSSENQLLQLFCRNHKPTASTAEAVIDFLVEFREFCQKKDSNFSSSNHFLIAFEGALFRTYTGTFEVFEVEEFSAVGAGADFAIAALALGHSAKEAVDLAIRLSVWCAAPVVEMEQPAVEEVK